MTREQQWALDPNDASAYARGAMSEGDAKAFESLLARSPEAREVYAEFVRLGEDVGQLPEGGVVPRSGEGGRGGPRRRRKFLYVSVAVAAAAASIALWPSTGGEGVLPTPVLEALSVDPSWSDHGWSVTRGAEVDPADPRAARLGVRWTDFQTAWSAGLYDQASDLGSEIVVELGLLPLSGPLIATVEPLLTEVADGTPYEEAAEGFVRVTETLALSVGEERFGAAAAVERARLAARGGQPARLFSDETRGALQLLATGAVAETATLVEGALSAEGRGSEAAEAIVRAIEALILEMG